MQFLRSVKSGRQKCSVSRWRTWELPNHFETKGIVTIRRTGSLCKANWPHSRDICVHTILQLHQNIRRDSFLCLGDKLSYKPRTCPTTNGRFSSLLNRSTCVRIDPWWEASSRSGVTELGASLACEDDPAIRPYPDPVHIHKRCFFKMHFNIILLSTPRSSNCSSGVPNKIYKTFKFN
jgi:hypothetical protein